MSSILSVAGPSQRDKRGDHRFQASAASFHCWRVVSLKALGSNTLSVVLMAHSIVVAVDELNMWGERARDN